MAITAVLISHFGIHYYRTWMGTLGVQLFFVLSGYLMANLLFMKEVPLPSFFVRRFSRVVPTVFVFVFVFVFVPAMAIYAYFRTGSLPRLDEFIATLTFTRTYFPAGVSILESSWPVGNLWSLNVEEHSYIFLAAVAVVARFANRAWVTTLLLSLSAAAVLAFVMYYPMNPPSSLSDFIPQMRCRHLR